MSSWVTHLTIADAILEKYPELHRRCFCVGNIGPDCNVENEDWSDFTPPKIITHWMSEKRKVAADADRFCDEYIIRRKIEITSHEKYSFLLGYYAHLITDAEAQRFIRDEKRVRDAWERIDAIPELHERGKDFPKDWDHAKLLLPKKDRDNEIFTMEAEYLREHPNSGYLTEILPLKEFPDYIDYLPHGSVVRKIGVMSYNPADMPKSIAFIGMSREEYHSMIHNMINLVEGKLLEKGLLEMLY